MIAPPTAVRCEGHTQDGNQCRREAILGGTVCFQHGGAAGHVRAKAAARIGNMADEMVKRLFAMLDDPETPHAVRSKIMQDMLDRAGLNATGKLLIGVGEIDPVEALFKTILNDPNGLAAAQPITREPSPESLAWNRAALESYGGDEDIVDAEVVEDRDDTHTEHVETVPTPAHIKRDLERLGFL